MKPAPKDPLIDPGLCPLCAQPNRCAMESQRAGAVAQAPCWCTTVNFAPDLLARVPAAAQNRACICAACAAATNTPAA